MAYEQRDNSGTLFTNDRKNAEKQPDYTGTAMIDGKTKRVSGWTKQGRRGDFISLSFSEPREEGERPASQRSTPPQSRPAPQTAQDETDDLPF